MGNKLKALLGALVMMSAVIGGMMVGCTDQPPPASEATPRISISTRNTTTFIGVSLTIAYSTTNAVSVTSAIAGGTTASFDDTTKKFQATAQGEYVLTLTAKNVTKQASDSVTITVKATINKTNLKAAIDAAKPLKPEDYTAFKAVSDALSFAESMYLASGFDQAQIDAACLELNTAIEGLVAKPVVKAVVEESKVIYNGTTYLADSYKSFASFKSDVANIEASLNSVYKTAFEALVGTLQESSYALYDIYEGTYYIPTLKKVRYSVKTNSTSEVKWYMGTTEELVSSAHFFDLDIKAYDTNYLIKVTVFDKGVEGDNDFVETNTVTAVFKDLGGYHKYPEYASSLTVNSAGDIAINELFGWVDNGNIATVNKIEGDFRLRFDLTATAWSTSAQNPSVHVILTEGNSSVPSGHEGKDRFTIQYRHYTDTRYNGAITWNGGTIRPDYAVKSTDWFGLNKTYSVELSRVSGIVDFRVYQNGKLMTRTAPNAGGQSQTDTATSSELTNLASSTGAVSVKFLIEGIVGSITNLSIRTTQVGS